MASNGFRLAPERWCGWIEVPSPAPGFAASPIRILAVTPLKTGQGRLRVRFIQPLWPGGGRLRDVVLTLVRHAPDHLVGSFEKDGIKQTAVIASVDFGWMESYCAEHWARRPLVACSMLINGRPLWEPNIDRHLDGVFGRSEDEWLNGATPAGSGVPLRPMPERVSTFMLDFTAAPFDSVLIARGFTPQVMEEKWSVLLRDGRLRFHRSWTGDLIYDVEACWRGDCLYLGEVRVNRDPDQYGETDDAYDRAMLRYLIDVVLRGARSRFPAKSGNAQDAALAAWSVAGSASLS